MDKAINFLKYRYIVFTVSLVLIVGFTAGTVLRGGLNFGIDFVGGVKIIAEFEEEVNESDIRSVLAAYNPTVQQIGEESRNEFIIATKLGKGEAAGADVIQGRLQEKYSGVSFLSVENVGPTIGGILKKEALKAILIAVMLMMVYLSFRFEIKYSVGAMAALLHDTFLAVVFCGVTGIEIDIPIIAAILTIFGYSVNDTIVIFDRIRENATTHTRITYDEVINRGVTQSISRTLLTSLTTLFSVAALYFIGGRVLNDFAQVLLFGIFVGTYSSIYIASPVLLGWERMRAK